jgi:hypothetical protein
MPSDGRERRGSRSLLIPALLTQLEAFGKLCVVYMECLVLSGTEALNWKNSRHQTTGNKRNSRVFQVAFQRALIMFECVFYYCLIKY